LLLSKKEKENLVIKLAKEGKTYREVAKEVHISPSEIKKILDKDTGDEKTIQNNNKEREKTKSLYAQAFQMFQNNKSLPEVVVELDIDAPNVTQYYEHYLSLKGWIFWLTYTQKFSKSITGRFSIISTKG
jgi:predicted transcriptional regulator